MMHSEQRRNHLFSSSFFALSISEIVFFFSIALFHFDSTPDAALCIIVESIDFILLHSARCLLQFISLSFHFFHIFFLIVQLSFLVMIKCFLFRQMNCSQRTQRCASSHNQKWKTEIRFSN